MVFIIFFLMGAFLEYPFEPGLLAGNQMALMDSPLSIFHNVALTPYDLKISSCYSNPFSIDGLHFFETAFSSGEISFGIQAFGDDIYRELTGAVGFKRNMGKFRFGLGIRTSSLFIGKEPPIHHPMVDLGFLMKFSDGYGFGISIRDFIPLSRGYLSSSSITLSLLLRERFLRGFIDLKMEEGFSHSLSLSGEMNVNPIFTIGTGISSNPPVVFVGFRIKKGIIFSYGYRFHMKLSGTHSLSLNYGH
jgi:hypothetical protein